MEMNGWKLEGSADERLVFTGKSCATSWGYDGINNWWRSRYGGSSQGWKTTSVSAVFENDGRATLQFANCNTGGNVKVYLNDSVIATSTSSGRNTIVSFNYDRLSELRIETDDYSIIKLNSLNVTCGKMIYH